jgi:hypothetical protein
MGLTLATVAFLAWRYDTVKSFPCELSVLGIRGPPRVAFAVGLVATAVQLVQLHLALDSAADVVDVCIPRWRLCSPLRCCLPLGADRLRFSLARMGLAAAVGMAVLGAFNSTTAWVLVLHNGGALICFLSYSVYVSFSRNLHRHLALAPLVVGVLRGGIGLPFKMLAAWPILQRFFAPVVAAGPVLSRPFFAVLLTLDRQQLIHEIEADSSFHAVVRWTAPFQWLHVVLLMACVHQHFILRVRALQKDEEDEQSKKDT